MPRRRVGRNELDTIQTLLAVVDAKREYARADADGNGFHDYAARFISSPGRKDGLYWPVQSGDAPSPLGPLIGMASRQGYTHEPRREGEGPRLYHGYYYRLLTEQGPEAPVGAYSYMVRNHLIGGFAVVAFPVRYGASGVMTLIVNHRGQVYQKDLGEGTADIATALESFKPDASWTAVESD